MAKLTRFTLPVFAGSATQTQTSVFGTMKTSPEYTTDVAAAINTQAYSDGWFEAIELGYAPFVEDMNSLQRAITYQISYGQQQGIPEWASDTEYYVGSFAKLNTATGAQVYCSLVDNNVGNLVSDTTKWKLVLDTANTCVTVNTAQTITAEKTFSVSPQVPTAAAGDSSTNAANTQFVRNAKNDVLSKIPASTGSSTRPVYINSSGTITACAGTVGGTMQPVYMNKGTITACAGTVGGTMQPVYMNTGTMTACSFKMAVVNSLPQPTDADTFYFLKEQA